MTQKTILSKLNEHINDFFKELQKFNYANDKIKNLNENVLSDKLAWLLDRNGDHNIGLKFANELIKSTSLRKNSLRNASVIREFTISTEKESSQYDILFIDLDVKDNIILAIENKYFSCDHKGQLEKYYETLQNFFGEFIDRRKDGKKFHDNAKIAYLTLLGNEPCKYKNEIKRLSWIDSSSNIISILRILNKISEKYNFHNQNHKYFKILEFINILKALQNIYEYTNSNKKNYIKFKRNLLHFFLYSTCQTLSEWDKGKRGSFKVEKNKIIHTSYYKKSNTNIKFSIRSNLHSYQLTMKTNFQGKKKNFYIPLNINSDQLNYLLYVSIYNFYKNFNRLKNGSIPQKIDIIKNGFNMNINKYSSLLSHMDYFYKYS